MCNQLGGPRATAIANSEKAKFMKFIPWAGVAARLSTSAVASSVAGEGSKSLPPAPRGAAYCFLPLPVQTGLPVHVNGYFELSSNRCGRGPVTGIPQYGRIPNLLLMLFVFFFCGACATEGVIFLRGCVFEQVVDPVGAGLSTTFVLLPDFASTRCYLERVQSGMHRSPFAAKTSHVTVCS